MDSRGFRSYEIACFSHHVFRSPSNLWTRTDSAVRSALARGIRPPFDQANPENGHPTGKDTGNGPQRNLDAPDRPRLNRKGDGAGRTNSSEKSPAPELHIGLQVICAFRRQAYSAKVGVFYMRSNSRNHRIQNRGQPARPPRAKTSQTPAEAPTPPAIDETATSVSEESGVMA